MIRVRRGPLTGVWWASHPQGSHYTPNWPAMLAWLQANVR